MTKATQRDIILEDFRKSFNPDLKDKEYAKRGYSDSSRNTLRIINQLKYTASDEELRELWLEKNPS